MGDRRTQALGATDAVSVFDVDCHAPRSAAGPDEHVSTTQIVVPRRGVFRVRARGDTFLAEATTALVLRRGTDYSVDHPADCGDRCTVVVLDEAILEDALGSTPTVHTPVGPAVQVATAVLSRQADPLALDEAAAWFLDALAANLASAPRRLRIAGHQRRRIDDVVSMISADPGHPWRLDEIARAVHVSPYHLSRQFKTVTGTTIWRHLMRLRVGAALDRLDGGGSLADVAAETGFAHHSHLTARFRRAVGPTPSTIRSSSSSRDIRHLRATTARF